MLKWAGKQKKGLFDSTTKIHFILYIYFVFTIFMMYDTCERVKLIQKNFKARIDCATKVLNDNSERYSPSEYVGQALNICVFL